MRRNPLQIEAGDRFVRLTWRTFEGQLESKLLITLIVGAPCITCLVLIATRLAPVEAFMCFGAVALVGLLIWFLVAGATELLLDERGLTRTILGPLGMTARTVTAALCWSASSRCAAQATVTVRCFKSWPSSSGAMGSRWKSPFSVRRTRRCSPKSSRVRACRT
ncbi:MAG TPA: hypothetical protein VEB22_05465 [Phycisphaerales bacterium]|nr:hypothetical protein [Phycisphaerales bacterium]